MSRKLIFTYLFGDLFDDEIVEWLELLGCEVVLALHVAHFKVDEASIRQDDESLLPAAEEARRFLVKGANLADASEVVAHDLVGKSSVSLQHLLLEALVAHEQLLLVEVVGGHHGICQSIIVIDLFVVDLLALSELGESAKCGQVVIDTTLLLSLFLVLFASFLFLETALDLFFDKELLASSGGNKLHITAFEVLLVGSKLLSFEIHLRLLRIEQLAFLEKL